CRPCWTAIAFIINSLIPTRTYSVALPFFKKGKDKTPSPAQKKSAPASEPVDDFPPTLPLTGIGLSTGSGIEVEETTGAPQSPVDEAAILYASGQSDMAEHLLKDILATDNRRAWHM